MTSEGPVSRILLVCALLAVATTEAPAATPLLEISASPDVPITVDGVNNGFLQFADAWRVAQAAQFQLETYELTCARRPSGLPRPRGPLGLR